MSIFSFLKKVFYFGVWLYNKDAYEYHRDTYNYAVKADDLKLIQKTHDVMVAALCRAADAYHIWRAN